MNSMGRNGQFVKFLAILLCATLMFGLHPWAMATENDESGASEPEEALDMPVAPRGNDKI